MRGRYTVLLPALLWFAASGNPALAQVLTMAEQDDIAEAVVRYAYAHDLLYLTPQNDLMPYLSIPGGDPSPEFLTRLSAAIGVELMPGSKMTTPLIQMRNSIVISISQFTITRPDIAQGSIRAFCGPTCGGQMGVTVEKRNGAWEVQRFAAGAVL